MNKILALLLIPMMMFAQDRIDGVAAVVGDQIILDSDISQIKYYYQSQGSDIDNPCEFIDQLLLEKTLTYIAKQDTILQSQITEDYIQSDVDQRMKYFLNQTNGDEAKLLNEFGLSSMAELQEEIKDLVADQAYTDEKKKEIVSKVDVSPEELKEFYNTNKYDLPDVPEEVEISHIVMYPELTEEHKQELIDDLNEMKEEVESGKATFAELAKAKSQDPGSAQNGGLYERVPRGKMVKQFDAVAFNLDEGQISEPFETEFGFHIIQLVKRRGQLLDLRHILLSSTPNKEEIKTAKNKLDSIETLIKDGKMTFKEAAYKFSDDKFTRYNAGVLTNPNTGESKWEKLKLSTNEFYAIAGLKAGDYTGVFEDDYDNKKVVRLMYINSIIPAHKLTMHQDYDRIKNYATAQKKQKVLEDYVKDHIGDTNIVISKEYKGCTYNFDWLQEDVN